MSTCTQSGVISVDPAEHSKSVSYLSINGVNLLQDVSKAHILRFSVKERQGHKIKEVLCEEGRLRAGWQL